MAQKTAIFQKSAPAAGIDPKLARALYADMVLIRRFEEKAAEGYALGKIGGFLHLYIGEEAVGGGAPAGLRPHGHADSPPPEPRPPPAKGPGPQPGKARPHGRPRRHLNGKAGP